MGNVVETEHKSFPHEVAAVYDGRPIRVAPMKEEMLSVHQGDEGFTVRKKLEEGDGIVASGERPYGNYIASYTDELGCPKVLYEAVGYSEEVILRREMSRGGLSVQDY